MDRSFRIYTFVTMALHSVFGILTSLDAPQIPVNGPTPWLGVWERMMIAPFLLWVAVLTVRLKQSKTENTVR